MGDRVRRSQLIYSGGVGAFTVLKSGSSVLCAGLDYWFLDSDGNPAIDAAAECKVNDWRLEARLGVRELRAPPANAGEFEASGPKVGVPYLLFPLWHVCPRCRRLKKVSARGTLAHYCEECAKDRGRRRGPRLVQVPLVAVCPKGHLEEFPWDRWIESCTCAQGGTYRLKQAGGTGLGNYRLVCEGCGRSRTLAGAVSEKVSLGPCGGRRPWLVDGDEPGCGEELYGALRNASNVYYGQLVSSVHLPRRISSLPREVRQVFDSSAVRSLVSSLSSAGLAVAQMVQVLKGQFPELATLPEDQLRVGIAEALDSGEVETDISEVDFRQMEYEALSTEVDDARLRVRPVDVGRYDFGPSVPIAGVSLVEDLTVTTALVGFSRLLPDAVDRARGQRLLWKRSPSDTRRWLPAVQVRGEGVFIQFDERALEEWENRPTVKARVADLFKRAAATRLAASLAPSLLARYVMIHTFSHALMRRMVFAAGYTATALAERIYAVAPSPDREGQQAGVLIYTASGDSEGSLGGLVRLGRPGNLEPLVFEALEEAAWCSSDPICMELGGAEGQGPDGLNLAACHSCTHVPETACERFNVLLDRALLVGSFDDPEMGLMSSR